jgi:hypothetical protein
VSLILRRANIEEWRYKLHRAIVSHTVTHRELYTNTTPCGYPRALVDKLGLYGE